MRVLSTIRMESNGNLSPSHKKIEQMNPKELMLYATAHCAALTIKGILDKEHIHPKWMEIEISGELDTEQIMAQSVYRSFNILYRAECTHIEEHNKIAHAIRLTNEKYCGLLQMLRRIAPVSHEISIVSTE